MNTLNRQPDVNAGADSQSRAALALLRPEGIGFFPVGLLESLAAIVKNAPSPMALLDEGFRHLGASDRYCTALRGGDYCTALRGDRIGVIGKTHKELFSSLPPDWELAQKRCLNGESSKFEHDWTPLEPGKRRRTSWQLHPWRKSRMRIGGAILFLQDADSGECDKEALEMQFQQVQKVESVCRLARRIAHDLNNMLLVINGYSSMMGEELEENSRLAKEAKAVLRAGERTAALAEELLSLSRI